MSDMLGIHSPSNTTSLEPDLDAELEGDLAHPAYPLQEYPKMRSKYVCELLLEHQRALESGQYQYARELLKDEYVQQDCLHVSAQEGSTWYMEEKYEDAVFCYKNQLQGHCTSLSQPSIYSDGFASIPLFQRLPVSALQFEQQQCECERASSSEIDGSSLLGTNIALACLYLHDIELPCKTSSPRQTHQAMLFCQSLRQRGTEIDQQDVPSNLAMSEFPFLSNQLQEYTTETLDSTHIILHPQIVFKNMQFLITYYSEKGLPRLSLHITYILCYVAYVLQYSQQYSTSKYQSTAVTQQHQQFFAKPKSSILITELYNGVYLGLQDNNMSLSLNLLVCQTHMKDYTNKTGLEHMEKTIQHWKSSLKMSSQLPGCLAFPESSHWTYYAYFAALGRVLQFHLVESLSSKNLQVVFSQQVKDIPLGKRPSNIITFMKQLLPIDDLVCPASIRTSYIITMYDQGALLTDIELMLEYLHLLDIYSIKDTSSMELADSSLVQEQAEKHKQAQLSLPPNSKTNSNLDGLLRSIFLLQSDPTYTTALSCDKILPDTTSASIEDDVYLFTSSPSVSCTFSVINPLRCLAPFIPRYPNYKNLQTQHITYQKKFSPYTKMDVKQGTKNMPFAQFLHLDGTPDLPLHNLHTPAQQQSLSQLNEMTTRHGLHGCIQFSMIGIYRTQGMFQQALAHTMLLKQRDQRVSQGILDNPLFLTDASSCVSYCLPFHNALITLDEPHHVKNTSFLAQSQYSKQDTVQMHPCTFLPSSYQNSNTYIYLTTKVMQQYYQAVLYLAEDTSVYWGSLYGVLDCYRILLEDPATVHMHPHQFYQDQQGCPSIPGLHIHSNGQYTFTYEQTLMTSSEDPPSSFHANGSKDIAQSLAAYTLLAIHHNPGPFQLEMYTLLSQLFLSCGYLQAVTVSSLHGQYHACYTRISMGWGVATAQNWNQISKALVFDSKGQPNHDLSESKLMFLDQVPEKDAWHALVPYSCFEPLFLHQSSKNPVLYTAMLLSRCLSVCGLPSFTGTTTNKQLNAFLPALPNIPPNATTAIQAFPRIHTCFLLRRHTAMLLTCLASVYYTTARSSPMLLLLDRATSIDPYNSLTMLLRLQHARVREVPAISLKLTSMLLKTNPYAQCVHLATTPVHTIPCSLVSPWYKYSIVQSAQLQPASLVHQITPATYLAEVHKHIRARNFVTSPYVALVPSTSSLSTLSTMVYKITSVKTHALTFQHTFITNPTSFPTSLHYKSGTLIIPQLPNGTKTNPMNPFLHLEHALHSLHHLFSYFAHPIQLQPHRYAFPLEQSIYACPWGYHRNQGITEDSLMLKKKKQTDTNYSGYVSPYTCYSYYSHGDPASKLFDMPRTPMPEAREDALHAYMHNPLLLANQQILRHHKQGLHRGVGQMQGSGLGEGGITEQGMYVFTRSSPIDKFLTVILPTVRMYLYQMCQHVTLYTQIAEPEHLPLYGSMLAPSLQPTTALTEAERKFSHGDIQSYVTYLLLTMGALGKGMASKAPIQTEIMTICEAKMRRNTHIKLHQIVNVQTTSTQPRAMASQARHYIYTSPRRIQDAMHLLHQLLQFQKTSEVTLQLGICFQELGNMHHAMDMFQATVVLVKQEVLTTLPPLVRLKTQGDISLFRTLHLREEQALQFIAREQQHQGKFSEAALTLQNQCTPKKLPSSIEYSVSAIHMTALQDTASCCCQLGDYDGAITALNAYLYTKNDHKQLVRLIFCYLFAHRFKDARDLLQKIQKTYPNNPGQAFAECSLLYSETEYIKCLRLCKEYLHSHKGHTELHYLEAKCMEKLHMVVPALYKHYSIIKYAAQKEYTLVSTAIFSSLPYLWYGYMLSLQFAHDPSLDHFLVSRDNNFSNFQFTWHNAGQGEKAQSFFLGTLSSIEKEESPVKIANMCVLSSLHMLLQMNPGAKTQALAAYMHRANHGSRGQEEISGQWTELAQKQNPSNVLALSLACLIYLQDGNVASTQTCASNILLALNTQKPPVDRSDDASAPPAPIIVSPSLQFASLILGYCLCATQRYDRATKVFEGPRYVIDSPYTTICEGSHFATFHAIQNAQGGVYAALSWGGGALLHLYKEEPVLAGNMIESALRCLDTCGAEKKPLVEPVLDRTRLWLYLLQTQSFSQAGMFQQAKDAQQTVLTLSQAELLAEQEHYATWQQYANLRGGMLATTQGIQHTVLASNLQVSERVLDHPVVGVEWLGVASSMLAFHVTALSPVMSAKAPSKKHQLRNTTDMDPGIITSGGINYQALCAMNNVMGVLQFMEYRYSFGNNIFTQPHLNTLQKKTYSMDSAANQPLKTELKDILTYFAKSRNAYNLAVLLILYGNHQEALSVLHSTILESKTTEEQVYTADGQAIQTPFADPTPIRNTNDVKTTPMIHLLYALCASSQQEHILAISHLNAALDSILKINRKLALSINKAASEQKQKHWIVLLAIVYVALGTEYAHTVAYSQAQNHYNQAALLQIRHCNVEQILNNEKNDIEYLDVFSLTYNPQTESPLVMRTDTIKILISTIQCNSAVCKFNLGFRAAAARELGISHTALVNICPPETQCFILLSCGDVCKAIELLVQTTQEQATRIAVLKKIAVIGTSAHEEELKHQRYQLTTLSGNQQFCIQTRNQAVTLCSEVGSGVSVLLSLSNVYTNVYPALLEKPGTTQDVKYYEHLLNSVHLVYPRTHAQFHQASHQQKSMHQHKYTYHYPTSQYILPMLSFVPSYVPSDVVSSIQKNEMPRWNASFARISIQQQQSLQEVIKKQVLHFSRTDCNPPPPNVRDHRNLLRVLTLRLPGTFDGMRLSSLGTFEQLIVHHQLILLEQQFQETFVRNQEMCYGEKKHSFIYKRQKHVLHVYITNQKLARIAQLAGKHMDVLKYLHCIVREGMIYHQGCECMQQLLQVTEKLVCQWVTDVVGFVMFNGYEQHATFPLPEDIEQNGQLHLLPVYISHATLALERDPLDVAAKKLFSRQMSSKSKRNTPATQESWMLQHYMKHHTEWTKSDQDPYSTMNKYHFSGEKTLQVKPTSNSMQPSSSLDSQIQSIGGTEPVEEWGLRACLPTILQYLLSSMQNPGTAMQNSHDSTLLVSLATIYIWKGEYLKAGDALLIAILLNPLNIQALLCRGHLALLHYKYVDFCTHIQHVQDIVAWNQQVAMLQSNTEILERIMTDLPSLQDICNINAKNMPILNLNTYLHDVTTKNRNNNSTKQNAPCCFDHLNQDEQVHIKCLHILKPQHGDSMSKVKHVCTILELLMNQTVKLYEVTENRKPSTNTNTSTSTLDSEGNKDAIDIGQLRTLLTHDSYDLHLQRLHATNDASMHEEHVILRTITTRLRQNTQKQVYTSPVTESTPIVYNIGNTTTTRQDAPLSMVEDLDKDILEAMSMKKFEEKKEKVDEERSAFDAFVNNLKHRST